MKKITLFIFIALIAALSAGCNKSEQSVVQNDGLVNFLTGDASVVSDGKTAALNVGDKITQGMIVTTGAKSIVEIHFQGSIIRISEKSSISMKELVKNLKDNKETTQLSVANGQVLFKVTRKLTEGEKFNIDTPTAVAGVRGTEFTVKADKKKSTISCTEGRVAVKKPSENDSTFVVVDAGREAVVEEGKPVFVRDTKVAVNGRKQVVEKKETYVEGIKGAAMIRAEAVKGDIEGKKE